MAKSNMARYNPIMIQFGQLYPIVANYGLLCPNMSNMVKFISVWIIMAQYDQLQSINVLTKIIYFDKIMKADIMVSNITNSLLYCLFYLH
jgi:hypothetical protein